MFYIRIEVINKYPVIKFKYSLCWIEIILCSKLKSRNYISQQGYEFSSYTFSSVSFSIKIYSIQLKKLFY